MEGQGCCKKENENACSTEKSSCSTEKTGSCGDKTTGDCGTGGGKGKCCPVTIFKGALTGAVVMFIWFAISWEALPWHKAAMSAPGAVGPDGMKEALGASFALYFVASALLTKILKKWPAGCCPVAGSVIIGLLVGLFANLPNVIWFHAPLNDALIGIADDVIAITLAGAALSKCILKSSGLCKTADKGCDTKASCDDKKTSCH